MGPSFSSCSISAHAGVVCTPSVGAVSVSHPTAGGPVSVSLPKSASMSPSPVEGKHSFHFSDSDFAAMPLVDSTAAADMQCPEMAPKTYNMRGPHEITRDMHTSGLSVVEVDVHSSPGGGTHHSTPSSTLEATVLGTTASITIPTPRKAMFFSGPYKFTVHSPQAVVGMVPPNAPHPEVIQEVHVDSLDDPLASRHLSSSPQVQVNSLDDPMARDPSSGHPRIPIASMDLSDPVPRTVPFCRRVLPGSPQPDIASLDGMSPCVLIASMDTDGSDVIPGCRGTHHPPSQHVAFSPMSEDERLLSMSTIPPDFSPPPPACEAEPMVACMHSGGVPAYHRTPAQHAPIPNTRHQHQTYHSPQPHVASLDSISPPSDRRVLFAGMDVDEPRPRPHPYVASLDDSCPTAPQLLIASMDM